MTEPIELKFAANIQSASRLAEWIFHDVRLNCDDQAAERTAERFSVIYEEHGPDLMLGMAGWWATSAYGKIVTAHAIRESPVRPELLPRNVEEIMNSMDGDEPQAASKRAFVSAQQFISTLTHDNLQTAEAIFNVAHDAGLKEFSSFMQAILMFSIRISNVADRMVGIR